jgi:outer membrane immunogenic protein
MKKILLSATALGFALTASAFAADLPSRKAPVVLPPPPPMWTGFYVGVNVGGTVDASTNTYVANGPVDVDGFGPRIFALGSAASGAAAAAGTAYPGTNNSGFIGGGQVGYNYQFGAYTGPGRSWVVGLEADIQGVTATGGGTTLLQASPLASPPFRPGYAVAGVTYAVKSLDYIGTVRGRIGALINPALLVYATGGLAYGGANSNTNQFEAGTAPAFGPFLTPAWAYSGSYSDTRIGWTAGAGLEWMFWSNWSAKVEYLYYDLGSVTYGDGVSGSVINVGRRVAGQTLFLNAAYTSAQFDGHIFRAGLNYHFNWAAPAPVLAKF